MYLPRGSNTDVKPISLTTLEVIFKPCLCNDPCVPKRLEDKGCLDAWDRLEKGEV
jgi:hypothetical protein